MTDLTAPKRNPGPGDPHRSGSGRISRVGPIQRELLAWIGALEYVSIGAATVPPAGIKLGGYSMDEVQPALDRLLRRGLIIEPKRGFYALPGWERPESQDEIEAMCRRGEKALEKLRS